MPNQDIDKRYWQKVAEDKSVTPKTKQTALEMLSEMTKDTPCDWCGDLKQPGSDLCFECIGALMFCQTDPDT